MNIVKRYHKSKICSGHKVPARHYSHNLERLDVLSANMTRKDKVVCTEICEYYQDLMINRVAQALAIDVRIVRDLDPVYEMHPSDAVFCTYD